MAYTPENNPYIPGDPYSYDLKWVVSNIKTLISNYTGEIDELKAFIMDYINNLDLSPVVAAELQEMYANGDFDAMLAQFITDNRVLLVDTDQSAIFTEAEKETGRKNLRAGGTNPNLLDNSWFTVNQRGQASYTGSVYTVDRWKETDIDTTINADNTLSLICVGADPVFFQPLPYDSDFVGKPFTLSLMFSDDDIFTETLTMPASGNVFSTLYRNARVGLSTISNTQHQFQIILVNDVQIKAAKLEYGTVSTLANDLKPNYLDEFNKCKQYFYRIECKSGSAIFIASDTAVFTTQAFMTLKADLRVSPSNVAFSGAILNDHQNSYNITSMTVSGFGPGYVRLTCNVSGGLTVNKFYNLALATNSYIDLSADL